MSRLARCVSAVVRARAREASSAPPPHDRESWLDEAYTHETTTVRASHARRGEGAAREFQCDLVTRCGEGGIQEARASRWRPPMHVHLTSANPSCFFCSIRLMAYCCDFDDVVPRHDEASESTAEKGGESGVTTAEVRDVDELSKPQTETPVQTASAIRKSLRHAKTLHRRTLSPQIWQRYPPPGRPLDEAFPRFKFGRRSVMFAPPVLTAIFILLVAISSLQKTSKRSEHHNMYSMLPSFEPNGPFYKRNLTNVKNYQMFYFKVTGAEDCELPSADGGEGSFFWASGQLWLDMPPAVSRRRR